MNFDPRSRKSWIVIEIRRYGNYLTLNYIRGVLELYENDQDQSLNFTVHTSEFEVQSLGLKAQDSRTKLQVQRSKLPTRSSRFHVKISDFKYHILSFKFQIN